jgi:hypothetical protein
MISLLEMSKNKQEWAEILQEIETLFFTHDKISQSSECREFNRRCSMLLQKLEDMKCYRLADKAMDLLASCNPKDLSQCDSIDRARYALMRLRYEAKQDLDEAAEG